MRAFFLKSETHEHDTQRANATHSREAGRTQTPNPNKYTHYLRAISTKIEIIS